MLQALVAASLMVVPAIQAKDTMAWKLVLERTIQPPDGSPGELIRPAMPRLRPDGQVLIVDFSPLSLKLFDANGRFVRTIGRDGAGPGEYRAISTALFGDSVIVQDPSLKRISVFDLQGNLGRAFEGPCCFTGFQVQRDARGRFVARGPLTGKGAQWLVYDASGVLRDSIRVDLEPPKMWVHSTGGAVSMFGIPFSPVTTEVVLRSGEILFGSGASYRLFVTTNGRDTVRTLERRGLAAVRIPTSTRDSAFNRITSLNGKIAAVANRSDMPGAYPYWEGAAEDGNGNIWVLARASRAPVYRLDVFSAKGAFVGSAEAPFRSLSNVHFEADRVVVSDTDEADLPRIRVFKVVKEKN